MAQVLTFLATWITSMWSMSLAIAMIGRLWCQIKDQPFVEKLWRGFAWQHQQLWLFVPPGALIAATEHWHGQGQSWLVFFDALTLFNWWNFRNWPEDNHWKRRGKKAKEAVERRAGRLVVVPATGGAS